MAMRVAADRTIAVARSGIAEPTEVDAVVCRSLAFKARGLQATDGKQRLDLSIPNRLTPEMIERGMVPLRLDSGHGLKAPAPGVRAPDLPSLPPYSGTIQHGHSHSGASFPAGSDVAMDFRAWERIEPPSTDTFQLLRTLSRFRAPGRDGQFYWFEEATSREGYNYTIAYRELEGGRREVTLTEASEQMYARAGMHGVVVATTRLVLARDARGGPTLEAVDFYRGTVQNPAGDSPQLLVEEWFVSKAKPPGSGRAVGFEPFFADGFSAGPE